MKTIVFNPPITRFHGDPERDLPGRAEMWCRAHPFSEISGNPEIMRNFQDLARECSTAGLKLPCIERIEQRLATR